MSNDDESISARGGGGGDFSIVYLNGDAYFKTGVHMWDVRSW